MSIVHKKELIYAQASPVNRSVISYSLAFDAPVYRFLVYPACWLILPLVMLVGYNEFKLSLRVNKALEQR